MEGATILVLLLMSCHILTTYTAEIDNISDVRFLTEEDTLVSPAGIFELGFFKPDSSENRYLAIWYKRITVKTVVWVANRDLPLTGVRPGMLRILSPGNLVLMNYTKDVIWSSNTTSSANTTVKLDDTVDRKDGRRNVKIILIGIFLGVLMIALSTWLCYAWRKKHHSQLIEEGGSLNVSESQKEAMELPLFSFSTIAKATANFSPDNKLGEGGFGVVYKHDIAGLILLATSPVTVLASHNNLGHKA
ncbi:S-locus glycoprotein domain-containing protein [Artemisia annua]|uniref:S-locus glycoprotein domain-containing protein n=1 Tax=Artemisia annua TaxID=35608 RepID=A0A2U1LW42_ARTAN|nr:S-locus glycoprotein domain-containing protein [Artemisia annua]